MKSNYKICQNLSELAALQEVTYRDKEEIFKMQPFLVD